MNLSRREILKFYCISFFVSLFIPKIAFAKQNKIKNIRTGLQLNKNTRLVIETLNRPSYKLIFGQKKITVILNNTAFNNSININTSNNTIIKSITQTKNNNNINIDLFLKENITNIPQNNIMILNPYNNINYRLVIDFNSINSNKTVIQNNKEKTTKKKIIVIDAGHGGKDPGCIGYGKTKEKNVVLPIAKQIKQQLDKLGFEAHLTRDKDIFLNLGTRASIAEKKHANLFLSIHANSNKNKNITGFSIYTLSKKASDEEAQKLADAENAADKIAVDGFEDYAPDLRIALSSLQQHAIAEMSVEYAKNCTKCMRKLNITQQKGRDIYHAPFAVLRSSIPGALIELGYLSNKKEEQLLKTKKYQNKLVQAIVNSIRTYDFSD